MGTYTPEFTVYNGVSVRPVFRRVSSCDIDKDTKFDREALLQSKQNITPLDRIPLVVTYHRDSLPWKAFWEDMPILRVSNWLSTAIKNLPLVPYHRPPNLKSLLVSATFRKSLPPYTGNSRCGQSRSKTYQHIKTVDNFKSSDSRKEYRVKAKAKYTTSKSSYRSNVTNVNYSMLET